MGGQHVREHRVGLLGFPVRGAAVEQVELALCDRVHVAELALHAVFGARIAFDDHHLAAGAERLGQHVAGHLGAGTVVGSDEDDVDVMLAHRRGIESDVDVDHLDSGLDRPGDRRDQRAAVGRGDDDRVDLLGDEVLDQGDLAVDIGLRLDAEREQRQIAALLRVLDGAFLHVLEELVGQRLHHQPDDRLLGLCRSQAGGERQRAAGGAPGQECATIHG